MSSRRHLTSVADGTARAFADRNNDVDGWWTLGILLATVPPGDPDYSLDLLNGEATPAITELDGLGAGWARYLRWSVERHGVSISAVRSAVLTVRFERSRDVPSWIPGRSDHPFKCTVTIDDDRGRRYERVVEGHCSRPSAFIDLPASRGLRRAARPHSPGRRTERIEGHGPSSDGDIPSR